MCTIIHKHMIPVNVKALVNFLVISGVVLAAEPHHDAYLEKNPCCSMPCKHRGVCNPLSPVAYECDCPKGYYGINCEKSTLFRWVLDKMSLDQMKKLKMAATGKLFWGIVNNIPLLHDVALRYVYLSGSSLGNSEPVFWNNYRPYFLDGYQSNNLITTGLPPVPQECPTPLGVKGPKTLPKVNDVFDQLLRRTEFKPCPFGTNLMFVTFAEYLAYEFFKTSFPSESSKLNSDVSRLSLRSWENGKLKSQIINGEEYPPYLKEKSEMLAYYPYNKGLKNFPKWAMEHEKLSSNPLMFTMATIWLREHNRVCDLLVKEHPDWKDERLYQSARLVLLGELLTITAGEYFQHLAQYRLQMGYKPNLFHGQVTGPSNEMKTEFNIAFQWEHLLPDVLSIHDKEYNMTDLIFGDNRVVFKHGLDAIVDSMSRNPAGRVTYQNCGKAFERTMKRMIEEGRRLRLHSLNDYRRFYELKPYESFEDFVGDEKMAKALEKLYGDIDAVEFVVGLFLEKQIRRGSIVPPTMIFLTGPVALREIMNNPIGSPRLWRPSTFGGKTAFDVVQKASLRKLFCLNMKGNCRNNVWVSFRTPGDVTLLSKKLNSEVTHQK